ncbi:MAG: hypothetical protein ACXVP1_00480 [Thermoleophilia bacterium]
MSRERAARRRLDPWAALLLGVLVTLGVIILLATPGPWHRVVPAVATRPPLAPPPPPRNVAVFVNGPRLQGCAGVVWLHIAYGQPRFTAVVVPARLSCNLPGAGLQPLAQIVNQAGPQAGARALGARLGVSFGSWITIDPVALRAALPGFVNVATKVVHPRPVPLVGVWQVHQPPARALQRQVRYLRLVLRNGSAGELNLVGFVNYMLGSTDVTTSFKLQALSAIGAALNIADAGDLVTSSLPVVVHRRGRYERWLPAPAALLALRQSFAFDAASPIYGATVHVRPAGRALIVLASPLGRLAAQYRAAFERELRGYGVRGVDVEMKACRSPVDVAQALDQGASRPSLGVIVALGESAGGVEPAAATAQVLGAALTGVQARALPAVVSEVPADTPINDLIKARAAAAGLPLSPVAAALAAPLASASPAASTSPAASASPAASTSPAAPGSPAASATPAASGSPAAAVGEGLTPAVVAAWARLDAATFVRAVQPAFFAPRLAATRLGVTYYERTLTRVAVVGPAPAAAHLVALLDVFGYAALRSSGSLQATLEPIVYYRKGDRRLALALAGDLGLRPSQVVLSAGGPVGLTVELPA